jgi:hypothetical protein
MVASRLQISGLPSWCLNLGLNRGNINLFQGHLRAGIREDVPSSEIFRGKTSLESDKLSVIGIRADTVFEVVEGISSWRSLPSHEQPRQQQSLFEWEGPC